MMYISKSIIDGLKILGFDKEVIKKVSREKSLEEIFLSTLFLNYLIVLVIFMLTIISGLQINGKDINLPVFWGLLMIYPFAFNVVIYAIYGLFGLVAEMLNNHRKVKPLISVGFHTAIVYGVLIYIISLISVFNLNYALFLFAVFFVYFLYTMFLAISTIYDFSMPQTLIVLFVPLFIIGILLMLSLYIFPPQTIFSWIFK